MKTIQIGLRGLALSTLFAVPLAVTGCGSGVSVRAAEADPQTAIEAMLAVQQSAWNKGDSATYTSVFSDDIDFINIRGQIFTGKDAVTKLHGQIFAGPFKSSDVSIAMRGFKLLAPGVALVDTDQTVTQYTALPPGVTPTSTGTLVTHFKLVALRQADGSWKFTSGQNTSVLPN